MPEATSTSIPSTTAPEPTDATHAENRIIAALHQVVGLKSILLALSVASETDEPVIPESGLYSTLVGIVGQIGEAIEEYMAATMAAPIPGRCK